MAMRIGIHISPFILGIKDAQMITYSELMMRPSLQVKAFVKRRILAVGIAFYLALFISGIFFQKSAVELFGQNIWPNLEATAISFPLETAFVYFVLDAVLAAREEEKVTPARRIVASKLVLVHTIVFQGAAIVFRPPSELDLDRHFNGPESQRPIVTYNFRRSGFSGWHEHLTEFREIIDLSSVALGGEWLPVVFAHYTAAKRAMESFGFFLNAFDPLEGKGKDFIGDFPLASLKQMEINFRWITEKYPDIDSSYGVPIKSPEEMLEMLRKTQSEFPQIVGKPEDYSMSAPGMQSVLENTDVMRRLKVQFPGHQVSVAKIRS